MNLSARRRDIGHNAKITYSESLPYLIFEQRKRKSMSVCTDSNEIRVQVF